MKENIADEQLNITEALQELWDRARSDIRTTSQKIQAIDKELAEKYRRMKESGMSHNEIIARLERMERQQNDDRQERKTKSAAVKRGVMQIIKAIWPD